MDNETQPTLRTLRRVVLSPDHHASLTKHTIRDRDGERNFPAFVSLEIASYEGEASCYLFHICADGQVADTWHQTVDEAAGQAEWEFGVRPEEWSLAGEPKQR